MGLLDYLNNAVDTVVTTVKEVVSPQSASEVSKVKETVPMISKEAQEKQKNEDTIEIKAKSIDSVYKQIENLCVEYRMSMEDAKKAQLLETIAGCSTEELAKKSDTEIKNYINALKFVLKYQSFKFFWEDRNIDDINKIAKKANERNIYLQTGGNCIENMFRGRKSLAKRMKEAGFTEANAETARQYFNQMISEAVATGDPKKIQKAYDKALKIFGYALNDTEDAEEKALLTAAISELEASKRTLAAQLSISSCQNNKTKQMAVAKGLSDNYRAMTCSADALGQYTSEEDNLKISQTAFQYMSEEDSLAALDETKSYIKSLEMKLQNGEALTEEEQRYYDSVRFSQYAGAMVGASCNNNYSSPDNVLGKIDNDTEELGIREQVYKTASAYVETHQNSLPITNQQFTQIVDKATNGSYTATTTAATKTENIKVQAQSQTTSAQTQRTSNQTIASQQTQAQQNTTINSSIEQVETTTTVAQKTVTTPKTLSSASTTAAKKENVKSSEVQQQKNPQEATATIEQAIKGGVKAVKKYAKENNVKTLDLAIDSLNSSSASHATRKWALSQFEAASNSEQILNFHKITHGSSAIAAAETMDDKTRGQLNTFRSYYIKESVENLNDNSVA